MKTHLEDYIDYIQKEFGFTTSENVKEKFLKIERENLVEKEIPTLSDGVMMLVSDDNKRWIERQVMEKKGMFYYYWYGNVLCKITMCKPIEKEPTKEEQLTAILGSSDKVSEIMELFKN